MLYAPQCGSKGYGKAGFVWGPAIYGLGTISFCVLLLRPGCIQEVQFSLGMSNHVRPIPGLVANEALLQILLKALCFTLIDAAALRAIGAGFLLTEFFTNLGK